ncbi:L-fuculokinase [Marinilabilia rubra]|uniref:L-fuculokinase n=1 Tax=Marinilabilia rubra TaxID=2162893 RepID=A0A2U2B5R1_9BACT|nr:L-fuculokinase [Marinilabilia rubra]PWD98395.1 L-fuculokinase [Marinilabilia rubra]
MHKKDIAIVFDCGATNIRVIAIDTRGTIIASESFPNETTEDPHLQGGRIWDLEALWNKFCKASKAVMAKTDASRIAGVTVTTFGVDGAFLDQNQELLYPVISWQCERTKPIAANIEKYFPLEELYAISGVFPYVFNTIFKMIWFKENKPEVIENADRFAFIPSLFIRKLGGSPLNDATMTGTSMMADLKQRKFAKGILQRLDLPPSLFGEIAEPGQLAGEVDEVASKATGLPKGSPLFFAGHDTQFALIGSGAALNQPVLSSGTWEILMARSRDFTTTSKELALNLTTEADAEKGLFNIGQNWMGSGVLEWFSGNFYPELSGDDLYETMIRDAQSIHPGSHGLMVNPTFFSDSKNKGGTIHGLSLRTSRAHIYRALLESLAYQLRESLETLQKAGNFKAAQIICVGGGSKNRLWNQLRADVCNLPLQVIDHKETTVLGAALFVFKGSGLYSNIDEARSGINYQPETFTPSEEKEVYEELFQKNLSFKKKTQDF